MIIAVSFILVLIALFLISVSEQQSLSISINKLEEMKEADRVTIKDQFDQEILCYEGYEVDEHIDALLSLTTFEEQYQKSIDLVINGLYMTISFFGKGNLLGAYQIFEVDDVSKLAGIEEKIMVIHQKPCFIEFNNRYWTLGDVLSIGK